MLSFVQPTIPASRSLQLLNRSCLPSERNTAFLTVAPWRSIPEHTTAGTRVVQVTRTKTTVSSNANRKGTTETRSKVVESDKSSVFPVESQYRAIPERARTVLLCFASFVICNCDRINISVAILPMAEVYGWSHSIIGLVQSAFFWGYLTTQIPGGYLSDRYGGRNVLACGVVAWSLMTVLTPMAASTSLPVLLAARAFLGVGEGVAMPAMNQIVSRWVPRSERSKALSLVYSGMYLGSTVGLLTCPLLMSRFGWPSVFYVFGGLGGLWWLAWNTWTAANPESSKTISESEKQYIADGTVFSRSKSIQSIPWKSLLSSPATWSIIVAHFCCTWGYFVMLTWLPTYFNMQLGFDVASSSFLSVLPWIAMFASANGGGLLADELLKRGMCMTHVRKLMQTVGFLGPSAFLGVVANTTNPLLAVLCMTCALALGSFSQSGVYSNHQDIAPRYSGVLLGMSNTAAAVPGIVGVALTGYLLDKTGSWKIVFGIAIGFYLLGTLVYNLFATGERVFE